MENVVYIGSSDYRTLEEVDFERAGISHKAETFRRGVPLELSNEAAGKLTSEDRESPFFGEFALEGEEPESFVSPSPGELVDIQVGPSTYGMNLETIAGLKGMTVVDGQLVAPGDGDDESLVDARIQGSPEGSPEGSAGP
jgi:hypothetical protein